jgi:hypothetical protein
MRDAEGSPRCNLNAKGAVAVGSGACTIKKRERPSTEGALA